jgi:hypothetical protein
MIINGYIIAVYQFIFVSQTILIKGQRILSLGTDNQVDKRNNSILLYRI